MLTTVLSLAMALERIFQRGRSEPLLSKDDIRYHWQESLQRGLMYLATDGVISSQEIDGLLEEYGFSGMTFDEIVKNENGVESINELIRRLKHVCDIAEREE